MAKSNTFSVIITDLNHNIRDLLYRELADERFDVSCLSTGPEVYTRIMKPGNTDVIILDPEMLYPYGRHLMENVFNQYNGPMIILHTYKHGDAKPQNNPRLVCIEKNECSIATIVDTVKQWREGKTEQ